MVEMTVRPSRGSRGKPGAMIGGLALPHDEEESLNTAGKGGDRGCIPAAGGAPPPTNRALARKGRVARAREDARADFARARARPAGSRFAGAR